VFFWWRVVNEFLPAKGILHRRHIEPIPNCDIYGSEEESIKHVLLDCTIARRFWEQTRALTGVKMPRLHPQTWAWDLINPSHCPERNAAIILCGMWSLWMGRNKRKHGEPEIPMSRVVEWLKDTAFDLWQLSHPIKHKGPTRVPQHWKSPPPGWTKCNVDASFIADEGRGATGMVLRDEEGRACGGRALWYDHCLNALTSEASACRDGIQFALDRGVQRLVLETDCQVLANLWEQRRYQSEVGSILQQIEILSRSLYDFSLIFSSRSCNSLAHECAKLVSRSHLVEEWLVPPSGLRGIIENDCNHVHDG
jgi:hypothetical protein